MNWNNYGRWRHPEYYKELKRKEIGNIFLRVSVILLLVICVWMGMELKETKERLKEEIQIKYEYASMIDSLMSEGEAIKHWNEENEYNKIK